MPIIIYNRNLSEEIETVARLCENSWSLCEQMYALEDWLKRDGKKIPSGDYVVDVGICGRTDFSNGVGGGAAFPPEAMAVMAEKGMYLFLSEYPNDDTEEIEETEQESGGND